MLCLMKKGMLFLFVGVCLTFSGVSALAQDVPGDYQEVLKSLDRKGDYKAGVLKVNIPRSDLKITIQGFSTPTPFGFGGWVALTKAMDGSDVMMGDLVLLQDDVKPVVSAAASSGGTPLDTAKLAKIAGHEGEQTGAVYKITVGRDDLGMKEHGATINARMGLNTWAAFVGTQEDAAIAGDVAMLEDEVTPVLKALRKNGLDVVAIHHHMTGDRPVVIFLHYWGRGPAEKLAAGFRAALDNIGGGHAGMSEHSDSSSQEPNDIVNAVKVTAQKDCGCGQCAAKGCDPCKGKNCHYCVAKALVVKDCGCGGCDAKGCSMCGPGCDVCKFHLGPSAAASSSGAASTKPN